MQMSNESYVPRTPSRRRPEAASVDHALRQLDLERRQRREGIRRSIFHETHKRVNIDAPALVDERSRHLKRRRVGLEVVLDDMEKENNYRPMLSVVTSFDSNEVPCVPSPTSLSLEGPLTCTLRPRNLNSAFTDSLSRRPINFVFDEDDELPHMPY